MVEFIFRLARLRGQAMVQLTLHLLIQIKSFIVLALLAQMKFFHSTSELPQQDMHKLNALNLSMVLLVHLPTTRQPILARNCGSVSGTYSAPPVCRHPARAWRLVLESQCRQRKYVSFYRYRRICGQSSRRLSFHLRRIFSA